MAVLTTKEIVTQIVSEFPCFGRGTVDNRDNPLSHHLSEKAPIFALGVDVAAVVQRVRQLSRRRATTSRSSRRDQ